MESLTYYLLNKVIASCNMQEESGMLSSTFPPFTFINEIAQITTLNQGLAPFGHIFFTECLSTARNTDVNRRLLVILATGFLQKLNDPSKCINSRYTHPMVVCHSTNFAFRTPLPSFSSAIIHIPVLPYSPVLFFSTDIICIPVIFFSGNNSNGYHPFQCCHPSYHILFVQTCCHSYPSSLLQSWRHLHTCPQ